MRSAISKLLSFFAVALMAAGCQSPQAAVGALQHQPFALDLLDGAAGSLPASTAMADGAPESAPPPGFVSFCMRFPDQCAAPADTMQLVAVTPAVWQLLNRVNDSVNAAIAPEDDSEHYGRAEYWTIPTDGYGDCEDYALTKRKALIAAGLPEDTLRIAVVLTWDGKRHAVLTVTTDKGDYVLDNMRGEILSWSDAGYTWIERQAASNPWSWVSLQSDGVFGPAVAALPAPVKPVVANPVSVKPAPVAEIAPVADLPVPDAAALLVLPAPIIVADAH